MKVKVVSMEDKSEAFQEGDLQLEGLLALLKNNDVGLHLGQDGLTILVQHKGAYTPCSGCDQYLTGPHACPGGGAREQMLNRRYNVRFTPYPEKRIELMRYLRDQLGYSLKETVEATTGGPHLIPKPLPLEEANQVVLQLSNLGILQARVLEVDPV